MVMTASADTLLSQKVSMATLGGGVRVLKRDRLLMNETRGTEQAGLQAQARR